MGKVFGLANVNEKYLIVMNRNDERHNLNRNVVEESERMKMME